MTNAVTTPGPEDVAVRVQPAAALGWAAGVVAILATSCVVVPCVFVTSVGEVFVVPKLAVLWWALALGFAVVAAGAFWSDTLPWALRPVWRVDAGVLAFVGLSMLASLFSSDRGQSVLGERLQRQGLLTLVLYAGFFFVARIAVHESGRMRVLLWAITSGAMLVSVYAVAQKAGVDPVWHGYLPGGRVFSSIGQANALAAYLVLAIPLAAGLALRSTVPVRAAAAFATATMLVALALAESRGGYLGLVVAASVFVVLLRNELGLSARHLVGAGAVTVLLTAAIVAAGQARPSGPFGRVMSTGDASVRFHLDAWRVASEVARDHPLLGTGPETFPDVFARYSDAVLAPERAEALAAFRVESPHDVYLAVAAGSGIPALVAYLATCVGLLGALLRAASAAPLHARIVLVAVTAAVSGHLVTDAFMTAEITGTWLFWLVAGATLGWITSGFEARSPGPARARAVAPR